MPPSQSILRALNHRHLLKSSSIFRPQARDLLTRTPSLAHHLHNPTHPRTSPSPTPPSSSLRNTTTFPSFASLPTRDIPTKRTPTHWCFLAEIVHASWFLRLRLDIAASTASPIPVFFYTPDKGATLVPAAEAGHTLAVFYATKRVFTDGVLGMRVNDAPSANVLPYSLDELMHANDKLFAGACATCGTAVPGIRAPGQIPHCGNKVCRTAHDPALRAVSRLLQRDWQSRAHAGAIHMQMPAPWGRADPQCAGTDQEVFRARLGLFPPTYEGPLKDLPGDVLARMAKGSFEVKE